MIEDTVEEVEEEDNHEVEATAEALQPEEVEVVLEDSHGDS